MKRIGLMTAALVLTVNLLLGGSCMIGKMGDGTQLWLHDGVTLAGEAQVLEARNFDVVNEDGTVTLVVSKIIQSAVGTGVAKALIGGGARVIAARERKATRVNNSAASKGGKGSGYGGDASAEQHQHQDQDQGQDQYQDQNQDQEQYQDQNQDQKQDQDQQQEQDGDSPSDDPCLGC